MELPIEFQNKANRIEERLVNTEHKIRGVDKADGYAQGALDMYKAIDSLLIEDLQLHTNLLKKAEKAKTK